MRNLIFISIFCLALSGLITFKALNLPEKKPRNASSQPSIKTHKNSQDLINTVPKPNREQDRRSKVNQTLQKPTSQREHPSESHKNTSQNILEIGKPENTEKSLGLLFSVNFNSGTFVIDDTTKKLIKQSIRPILSMPPNYHLIVEGHTDNLPVKSTAEKTYLRKGNKNLSLYRAKKIADMLENEGIPSNRISAIGYGAKRPIASNNTVEGREKNRRVVIRLITPENSYGSGTLSPSKIHRGMDSSGAPSASDSVHGRPPHLHQERRSSWAIRGREQDPEARVPRG
jgi:outer membrane protein OmpA-like peptidoglycan-associated protein